MHVQPWIGAQLLQRREPRVRTHVAHRVAVAAADQRGERPEVRAQDHPAVLGGSLIRLPGLVGAPPREALLALAAGLRATLNVPTADLRGDDRVSRQLCDGEAALPNQ